MRPVALIAANFLREQRWYIVLLLVWVIASAALFGLPSQRSSEDAVFFLRQQAVYGLALTVFLAAGAIHSERRTRRILLVLAKAVTRRQYLAGLFSGAIALNAMFLAATALAGSWLARQVGWPVAPVWEFAGALVAASALLAAFALLFSSFAHPLIATALTALAAGMQLAIERFAHGAPASFLPARGLLEPLMAFHFHRGWEVAPAAIVAALIEAMLLWLLASAIFARRDIAVAVE